VAGGTPLLSFANVSKRRWDGSRALAVLDGVSLLIDDGAFVGLYGARRSGKSTLLRLAAGLTLADEGSVRIDGNDLAQMAAPKRARLLRGTVGLVSADTWSPRPREDVVEYLTLALGCEGLTAGEARRRAYAALDEVGMAGVGLEATAALPLVERMSVMLARALLFSPRLLLIDEPAVIPSLSGREQFGSLLHTLGNDRKLAVLLASEELIALQGAAVMMSIGAGELTSSDDTGVVVPFPGRTLQAAQRSAL
jgi:predicted ABC-type transport system involved in lysophospholipase L1 biosynthesis ATPase subunit